MPNFDTGPSLQPDVGKLSYNGCKFSPLFVTSIHGNAVKDNAKRTVKLMEYGITADGYVTLPDNAADIDPTMRRLRNLLTAQAGHLIYGGRGFNLNINAPGSSYDNGADVAWGPVPELIEFQPLGGGRSAKVQWKVTTRLPEYVIPATGGVGGAGAAVAAGRGLVRLLQFVYDSTVTYGEDGYSSMAVKSTIEIPLTRLPNQGNRVPATTADDIRFALEAEIFDGVDLSRFRVTHRDFALSQDKRTLEITYTIEEKPYMDLPPYCTIARGNYSVRPAKAGMGLIQWMCTLKGTYTIRADIGRRYAWYAFLAMLRLRMSDSQYGGLPTPAQMAANLNVRSPLLTMMRQGNRLVYRNQSMRDLNLQRAFLIDFSYEEGMYLDSKTISFTATWKLISYFRNILLASGIWRKLQEADESDTNLWAISMTDISGSKSWLQNRVDPNEDLIVDFGTLVGG